jgi:hypothetical protein
MPVSTAMETRKLFSYKIIINVNLLSGHFSCSSFAIRAQVSHANKTTCKIIVHISHKELSVRNQWNSKVEGAKA